MRVHIPETRKNELPFGAHHGETLRKDAREFDLRLRTRRNYFSVANQYRCVWDRRFSRAIDERSANDLDCVTVDAGDPFGHFVECGHFIGAGAAYESSECGFVAFADGFEVVELGVH